MSDDRVVTANEAALMCGVSPVTIRMWVFRGYLRPVAKSDVSGRHLFYAREVEACNARRKGLAGHRVHERVINGTTPTALGDLSADQIDVLRAGLFYLLKSSPTPIVAALADDLAERLTDLYLAIEVR